MEKPLAGSNPMLHFQIRTPSTDVRPPTTLFHGLLVPNAASLDSNGARPLDHLAQRLQIGRRLAVVGRGQLSRPRNEGIDIVQVPVHRAYQYHPPIHRVKPGLDPLPVR